MERKAGSGRKGTVDEEEYLLRSVNKLVDRFNLTLGKYHVFCDWQVPQFLLSSRRNPWPSPTSIPIHSKASGGRLGNATRSRRT